ncbi:MAG: CCA tRNA nucleotidyltransferase [Methylobacteriaceae bacterium]|nr:CCA tRNA nucleotidyltransferase [Methylobacteriaceae bacterium]
MSGAGEPAQARIDGAAFLREGDLPRLMAILNDAGEEVRVVGGAVRNALLGLDVADVDLATTALPQVVVDRATAAGFNPVPTGIKHGTITVVVEGKPFEVTTLRADIETDGRHAVVRFGRDFAEDALRRDFTINALFATADGRVFDYTGGIADLAARHVRFIGDAGRRIREDYLRILRFFRFHAVYGEGEPDRAGFDAAVRERHGLARLSRERVSAELMKLLVARRAAPAAAAMSEAGLLGPLLGGIAMPARLGRVADIEAARGKAPDAILRLAALALTTVEDADRLREALRLSNEAWRRLAEMAGARAKLHGRTGLPSAAELTELLFLNGRRTAKDALTLAHAESAAAIEDAEWSAARHHLNETPQPRLPISGADILARGIPSGVRVGEVLKALQARWIRAGFPREPATLAHLLDEVVGAVGRRAT